MEGEGGGKLKAEGFKAEGISWLFSYENKNNGH